MKLYFLFIVSETVSVQVNENLACTRFLLDTNYGVAGSRHHYNFIRNKEWQM